MTPDRRERLRHGVGKVVTWGRVLVSAIRNAVEILLGVLFGITASHGRLVHDAAVTWPDCTLAFLGACTVLGYRGLTLYRLGHEPPGSSSLSGK